MSHRRVISLDLDKFGPVEIADGCVTFTVDQSSGRALAMFISEAAARLRNMDEASEAKRLGLDSKEAVS